MEALNEIFVLWYTFFNGSHYRRFSLLNCFFSLCQLIKDF